MRRRNARRFGVPRCTSCAAMRQLKPGIFPRAPKLVLKKGRLVCPNCGRPEKVPTPTTADEGSNG
jgi:hypothetical protein